jgi:hypothetical protein
LIRLGYGTFECCTLFLVAYYSHRKTLLLIEEGETFTRLGYGTFECCFLGLADMKAKAPKAIVEPFNTNSMTKLLVTINNNGLLIQ